MVISPSDVWTADVRVVTDVSPEAKRDRLRHRKYFEYSNKIRCRARSVKGARDRHLRELPDPRRSMPSSRSTARVPQPQPIPDDPGSIAGRAVARLAKQVELCLVQFDLSLHQYRVLGYLAEGPTTGPQMGAMLAIAPPSVTAVVDLLVARDFVTRQVDSDDRRRHVLVLTETGAEFLAEVEAAIDTHLATLATGLDVSSRDAMSGLEQWHVRWPVWLERFGDDETY
jgi:DNA-binding MarR family transcriptional regulator